MKNSTICGGRKNEVSGKLSLAFGNGVTVDDNYTAAFFNDDNPGVVKISNVLKLEPQPVPLPDGPLDEAGYIAVGRDPITLVSKVYFWDGDDWLPLAFE